MKKSIKTLLVITPIVVLCVCVPEIRKEAEQAFFLFGLHDLDSIKGYILSFGMWAPVVSFLLMIFQSIIAPLPAFLITFSNAALFGWVYGALLSWASAMVGAALCFFLARYLGREFVEKMSSKFALENIDSYFKEHGKNTILVARLLPFISFDIVSYAAGLTSMSFRSFFIATGIGQLPATLIYSYAGEMLTGSARTFVMGLLILFAMSALAVLLKKIFCSKDKPQPHSV